MADTGIESGGLKEGMCEAKGEGEVVVGERNGEGASMEEELDLAITRIIRNLESDGGREEERGKNAEV